MTQGEAVAKAHRLWLEEKRSGFLIFDYRGGVVKGIEHQVKEYLEGKSARRVDVPPCPVCGEPMRSRDGGALFVCEGCSVKRTEAQLRSVK